MSPFIVLSGGFMPEYQDEFAAGCDLHAAESVTIAPGDRIAIRTGLILDTTPNRYWYLRIAPRSGLALNKGLDVLAGVVDSSYREEIKVVLINTGREPVIIKQAERIAQGIFTNIFRPIGIPVKNIVRSGGFGSTGA